jgi:hypothetical protein
MVAAQHVADHVPKASAQLKHVVWHKVKVKSKDCPRRLMSRKRDSVVPSLGQHEGDDSDNGINHGVEVRVRLSRKREETKRECGKD